MLANHFKALFATAVAFLLFAGVVVGIAHLFTIISFWIVPLIIGLLVCIGLYIELFEQFAKEDVKKSKGKETDY